MNLTILPIDKNRYPLKGVLIKNKNLSEWLIQLQKLQVDLNNISVFAIPDNSPNSIWGCFACLPYIVKPEWKNHNIQFCQSIQNKLFIPEHSNIFPQINDNEISTLFSKNQHILHPEFGLFELETPIIWNDILNIAAPNQLKIVKPSPTPFYPSIIRSIKIKPLPPEESLKEMEEKMFPKKESFKDKPLNLKEKISYFFLKKIFKPSNESNLRSETANILDKVINFLFPSHGNFIDKLEQNFEDLERRNSSELEKLMKLFKNKPEEALKYAIPIDNSGTGRGFQPGSFSLSKFWSSFDLFGNTTSTGGGNVFFEDDKLAKLQQQYYQTAAELVKEKKYDKAAFVYLKLLKNNHLAATTLENGKLYTEAASVYLKYLQNKEKAAQCYETGRMTNEAIELYKELNKNEKVGDLYTDINNKIEANYHYQIVVEDYKQKNQYIKAALLLKNKMDARHSAQEILLNGWRNNYDRYNCINNYFANIEDESLLTKEINAIYKSETDLTNKEDFLKALKIEYKKGDNIAAQTKAIAYEIVSTLAKSNPNILNDLTAFNKDTHLKTDINRFKNN